MPIYAKPISPPKGFSGVVHYLELSEPIKVGGSDVGHLIVSSVVAPATGPETLVFPADGDGILSWTEVIAYRPNVNLAEALAGMPKGAIEVCAWCAGGPERHPHTSAVDCAEYMEG